MKRSDQVLLLPNSGMIDEASEVMEEIVKKAITEVFGEEWELKARVVHFPGRTFGKIDPMADLEKFKVVALATRKDNPHIDERIIKIRVDKIGLSGTEVTVLATGIVPTGEADKTFEKTRNATITLGVLEKFLKVR